MHYSSRTVTLIAVFPCASQEGAQHAMTSTQQNLPNRLHTVASDMRMLVLQMPHCCTSAICSLVPPAASTLWAPSRSWASGSSCTAVTWYVPSVPADMCCHIVPALQCKGIWLCEALYSDEMAACSISAMAGATSRAFQSSGVTRGIYHVTRDWPWRRCCPVISIDGFQP
jgi:hypothetical protein